VMPFSVLNRVIFSVCRLFCLAEQNIIFLLRMSFYPQTSQAVFHHITNNTVWSKKLSRCRYIFFLDLSARRASKNLSFWFCIVILLQPTNDLYLSAFFYIQVFLWNIIHQMINHTFF